MAPSFSATPFATQTETCWISSCDRVLFAFKAVLFEAAQTFLIYWKQFFSAFRHFCWCFCRNSRLDLCRGDGWGGSSAPPQCCVLLFRTPNDQARVKRTLLCPQLWAGTASLPLGESRRGTLSSRLPSPAPQCRPTPPGPDHVPHKRCSLWGLAWGMRPHQCYLVSLSVTAATVLCRQAVPSA